MCLITPVTLTRNDYNRDKDDGDCAPYLESQLHPVVATGIKDFLVLTYTQVVGLCLAAFAMGGLMPMIYYKKSLNHSDNGVALFNNLRYSSSATRTDEERQNPKIAWRKSN